jgi:hypothetical protein
MTSECDNELSMSAAAEVGEHRHIDLGLSIADAAIAAVANQSIKLEKFGPNAAPPPAHNGSKWSKVPERATADKTAIKAHRSYWSMVCRRAAPAPRRAVRVWFSA